jgi:hypothetical protein
VKPTSISTPRWKIGLYLGISLMLVAVGLTLSDRSDPEAWKLEVAVIFFGLCGALLAWLLVFPGRVLLDAEGFTMKGGFGLIPWTVRWHDVDAFVPLEYSRGLRMIGFRYRPGWRHPSRRRFTRWRGADELLPILWRSPQKVIDQLNEYRIRALAAGAGETTKVS